MIRMTGADGMSWRYGVIGLGLSVALASCQATEMAGEQEATTTEAAEDARDGPDAEDGFGEVVGGGSAGRGAGELPDVGDFRDPRFGRSGSLR